MLEVQEPDPRPGDEVVVRPQPDGAERPVRHRAGVLHRAGDRLGHRVRGRHTAGVGQERGKLGEHLGRHRVVTGVGVVLAPARATQSAQQRVEVGLPAGRAGVDPAEGTGPGQQRGLGRPGVRGAQLVLQGGGPAQVVEHQDPPLGVVREQLGAHPFLRRQRREQLVTGGLPGERVRFTVDDGIVLDHQGAGQCERRRGDPGPHHGRRAAAGQPLGFVQRDRAAEPGRQHRLGRRHRDRHRGLFLSGTDGGGRCRRIVGGGGIQNHRPRPY